MRFRSTIVLLLLLVGLGAYVYWVEIPKAQQEAKKKTLFDFKADDVTQVSLTYTDREIVLKKSDGTWRLIKPIDTAADQTTVKNLVNAIAQCEVKKELTEASTDLAQFGLDKPMVKVDVKLGDKELPTVLVGKNTPVGFSTYVEKAGDKKILLTAAAFRSGMDKTVKDVRDKTIIHVEDSDINKVEIDSEGKQLTLARKDDRWSIEQPGPYPADDGAVRSFLSTLRSMRAVDFPNDHPTDLDTYGLNTPRLTVTLSVGKDNAEKRVLLGKEAEGEKKALYVQASGQPTIYTVSDWVYRDLNKGVGDFRDKTVLAFDRDKVTALELHTQDGKHVKLTRTNKQWQVEGAAGTPAETTISQYLTDLHDLKGYEIAADHPTDLSQFGLSAPALQVTVIGKQNKPLGTILLGTQEKDNKKEYTAMTQGGTTVFRIRDYLFTRLNKQPHDFVKEPTPSVATATPVAQLNNRNDEDAAADDEPMDQDEAPAGEQG